MEVSGGKKPKKKAGIVVAVLDGEGGTLANAHVELLEPLPDGKFQIIREQDVDRDGIAKFLGLEPSKSYGIEVLCEGGEVRCHKRWTEPPLSKGEVRLCQVALYLHAGVEGKVVFRDEQGNPADGNLLQVEVSLTSQAQNGEIVIDGIVEDYGTFVVPHPTAGQWTLKVRYPPANALAEKAVTVAGHCTRAVEGTSGAHQPVNVGTIVITIPGQEGGGGDGSGGGEGTGDGNGGDGEGGEGQG